MNTSRSISTDRNSLDLERYVPALVTSLANKLSSGASACYRKHFGVGVVEWRLLAMLAVETNITANRICQVIGLDKAAVSRSLKQLEESGHVLFSKDLEDGRRVLVALTPEGKCLHDRILKVALQRERLLLGDFTDEECDALVNLLLRMNARVGLVNSYDPERAEA
ncbi:transcriptional regulator [Marinobacterium nitratireducens]|uniref:Transcriptional regulator n=1 Tax=Marinobacterium nitratireducens TaxID=518897 RepID=A0A917Z6C9_9GAMM|nr:MarR family transcriptional regulator [Marinobacterium nitratireducens]GGO76437.1 transcriptional regulator [Marinobacterium nitratireducens]